VDECWAQFGRTWIHVDKDLFGVSNFISVGRRFEPSCELQSLTSLQLFLDDPGMPIYLPDCNYYSLKGPKEVHDEHAIGDVIYRNG